MFTSETHILETASKLVRTHGLQRVTREAIARKVGCASGTINYYFKSMAALRDAIVVAAIKAEDVSVLAKAFGEGHPAVDKLPAALRAKVANHLMRT